MELTQEFLAQMLGVRRTSVSLVANTLQQAGFIKYRRGHIRIVDVEGVRSSACATAQRGQSTCGARNQSISRSHSPSP